LVADAQVSQTLWHCLFHRLFLSMQPNEPLR
jgi:hypothetical protein